MAYNSENAEYEKGFGEKAHSPDAHHDEYDIQSSEPRALKRHLQGRHMQMIAIGGAIGAGFFVGSGGALKNGGPAALVIGFAIIGVMLLCVMQALAELTVLYPVNGAFYSYSVRFVDRSWGFANGFQYGLQWLTVLPFEISAASITLGYWQRAAEINQAVWVAVFLVALIGIQVFGVRGYGESEMILSMIKIIAVTGFIIFAIVLDCGGVSSSPEGYIGARYWYEPGAFQNGFQGFCTVFVTASFAYGGTELVGLAAAEAENPLKAIPQATKQVFWRISIFYIVGLLMVGLVVSSDYGNLLGNASYSATSPFVHAIEYAGLPALASVFNVVITLSVISVANSCTFASTRTYQAMALNGMLPKFMGYVDKKGRPIPAIILQVLFGFLAFIIAASSETREQFFGWLLSLSGLSNFFIWGSICLAHIRFRAGWAAQGRTLSSIPYKAAYGVWGSWVAIVLVVLCLIASFYTSLYPIADPPGSDNLDPQTFFQNYLAAPLILVLYLFWKVFDRDWSLFIRAQDMDLTTGLRTDLETLEHETDMLKQQATWGNLPIRIVRSLF